MSATVKDIQDWLNQSGKRVEFPGGLPKELSEIRDAVALADVKTWFDLGAETLSLSNVTSDPTKLTMAATVQVGGVDVKVGLLFLTRSDSPAVTDLVEGLRLTLMVDVTKTGVGFLTVIGLQEVELRYELWRILGVEFFDLTLCGEIAHNAVSFELACRLTPGLDESYLEFTITPTKDTKEFTLDSLLGALGLSASAEMFPGLPDVLPALTGAAVRYAKGESGGDQVFVFLDGKAGDHPFSWVLALLPENSGKRPCVLSGDLPIVAGARLSDIDLLRGQIPVDCDLSLDVQLCYASTELTAADILTFNTLTGGHTPAPAPLPAGKPLGGGFHVIPWVSIGSDVLALQSGGSGQNAALPGDTPGGGSSVSLQRSLGPLHVGQLVLRLIPGEDSQPARVMVGLDAAFAAAGFELEATGLGLSVELTKNPQVQAVLSGLGVAYSREPLEVMGALVSRPADLAYEFAYDGLIMVKAAKWEVTAVGSYARVKAVKGGHSAYTSLFIFGALEGKIGGPPPVVITGLCLGFGYNSKVALPEADQVADFPFVHALGNLEELTGVKPGEPVSPTAVLEKITGGTNAVVSPAADTLWAAAGLSFSVAEIVDATALLMVQFGDDLMIALLGTISAEFPARSSGKTLIAHLELGFRALYEQSKHQFSLTAALSDDSWVVYKDCKLTGGAALYLWFSGSVHEGDFVATIGGYHPAFRKPDHYPAVPRLGLSWSVSSAVSVKGELYLAITPNAGMVGGRLEVNYDAGGLRAWLIAYFNVIVWWAPLYFRADIGITIGVSYTLDCWLFSVTIRVEIGADLIVWGPPTGGRAHLKVGPFSVNIGFGADENQPFPPLSWQEFHDRQLPKEPITIGAVDGLLTDPVKIKQAKPGHWVVSTDGFTFATRSAIPATQVSYNGKPLTTLADDPEVGGVKRQRKKQLDVRPMNHTGSPAACSTHTVSVVQNLSHGPAAPWQALPDQWTVTPSYAAVPKALWGQPADQPPSPDEVSGEGTEVFATGLNVWVPPPALIGAEVDTSFDVIRDRPWTGPVNPLNHATSTLIDPEPPTVDPSEARAQMLLVLTQLSLLELIS